MKTKATTNQLLKKEKLVDSTLPEEGCKKHGGFCEAMNLETGKTECLGEVKNTSDEVLVSLTPEDLEKLIKAGSLDKLLASQETKIREAVEGMRRSGVCDEASCYCEVEDEDDCRVYLHNQALDQVLSLLRRKHE